MCYNDSAVDSFQQEGGEQYASVLRFSAFHHSICNSILQQQRKPREWPPGVFLLLVTACKHFSLHVQYIIPLFGSQ